MRTLYASNPMFTPPTKEGVLFYLYGIELERLRALTRPQWSRQATASNGKPHKQLQERVCDTLRGELVTNSQTRAR